MKKRKGVALITVIIVGVFTFILATTLLRTSLTATNQNVYARGVTQSNYVAFSGLNIISSYIINTNDEFLVQYNNHLNANGNDREEPFVITLEQYDEPIDPEQSKSLMYSTDVSVTSTQSSNTTGSITTTTTVYTLSSVGEYYEQESSQMSVEITETDVNGSKSFEIGKYIK